MTYYCKETGEEQKPNGDCLIHGKCDKEHFEYEKGNRVCEICGRGFWCMDNIRLVCSMECAREYAETNV